MRVVILGSGRGSNAEAILLAQSDGRLGQARVVQIFSDRPDAGILALGPRFGVPAAFLDPAPFKTKLEGEGEQRYIAAITACQPDLVVLAGFMRVVKAPLLEPFAGRIINLHDNTYHVNTDMFDPNELANVDARKVKSIVPSKVSPMPEGLLNMLKPEEVLDLLAYLLSGGDPKHAVFAAR